MLVGVEVIVAVALGLGVLVTSIINPVGDVEIGSGVFLAWVGLGLVVAATAVGLAVWVGLGVAVLVGVLVGVAVSAGNEKLSLICLACRLPLRHHAKSSAHQYQFHM